MGTTCSDVGRSQVADDSSLRTPTEALTLFEHNIERLNLSLGWHAAEFNRDVDAVHGPRNDAALVRD